MYLKKKNFSNNWIVLTNISLMLYASKRQLKWYKFTNYQSYLAYFRNKRKLSNQNVNQWNMNWPLNKHFITFNLNFDFYDFVAKINYDRQPLFNHVVKFNSNSNIECMKWNSDFASIWIVIYCDPRKPGTFFLSYANQKVII